MGVGACAMLPKDRDEWFTLGTYVILVLLGIAGVVARDLVPTTIAAFLSTSHILRDFSTRHYPFGTNSGKRPLWPWWSDYVLVLFGLLLLRSAAYFRSKERMAKIAQMVALGGVQHRSDLPEVLLFAVCGVMMTAAHGRQIFTRDGCYYDWMHSWIRVNERRA